MENNKVFIDYLFEMLKIISFALALTWLCSCGQHTEVIIKQIRDYKDSIGITTQELNSLDDEIDSLRDDYVDKYPARAFGFKKNDSINRLSWHESESAAYAKMNDKIEQLERWNRPIRAYLLAKIAIYQSKVDSLKLELER